MLLHPDAQFYIDTLPTLSAEEQVSFGKDAPVSEADATHVATDQDIAGVPVRVYTPLSGAGDLPCLVYFHGGGWSGGTLNMIDATVHSLVVGLPIIAISVDYRLAPAHPFPAAIDDAFAVVSAVLDGVSGLVLILPEWQLAVTVPVEILPRLLHNSCVNGLWVLLLYWLTRCLFFR